MNNEQDAMRMYKMQFGKMSVRDEKVQVKQG